MNIGFVGLALIFNPSASEQQVSSWRFASMSWFQHLGFEPEDIWSETEVLTLQQLVIWSLIHTWWDFLNAKTLIGCANGTSDGLTIQDVRLEFGLQCFQATEAKELCSYEWTISCSSFCLIHFSVDANRLPKWVEVDCPDLPATNRKDLRPFIFFIDAILDLVISDSRFKIHSISRSSKVANPLGFWGGNVGSLISQLHLHPLSTSLDMTSRTTRLSMTWGQPTLSPFLVNLGLKELTDCHGMCWTLLNLLCFTAAKSKEEQQRKREKNRPCRQGVAGVVSPTGSWYIEHRNHRHQTLAGPHSGWTCILT